MLEALLAFSDIAYLATYQERGRLSGRAARANAITLSSRRLHNLDAPTVTGVVNVVTLANLAFKSVLTLSIGGWQMARHAIAGMGAVGLGLVATWAIIRGFSA